MEKNMPDADAPISHQEWDAMGNVMRGIDGLPQAAREAVLRLRGRPKIAEPKQRVTIRLDADVISTLRNTGTGWQTRVNDFLRHAMVSGQI